MPDHSSTLDKLFAHTFESHAARIAVIDADAQLNYSALDALACRWASALSGLGIECRDTVVLFMPRSASLIVALHALVKIGCTIVPISHDVPVARLEYIVANADATAVLIDSGQADALPGCIADAKVHTVQSLDAAAPATLRSPAPVTAADDTAYIVYTSGTTGNPKGVATSHAAISKRYEDWCAIYGLRERPLRILQVAKAGFDVFIGDVVKAMGSGGTLVLCPDMAILQPDELYRWLIGQQIDYVDMVPAILRNLVEYLESSGRDLQGLAMLNCGADLWTKAEYLRFRGVLNVQRLFNSYGVTECSVESTIFEDDGTILAGKDTLPIGKALPSDIILIVDDALEPVPPGTIGQLCIGGPCVATGYVKLPDLNRSVFVRLDAMQGNEIFYLTGDLARMDAKGIIEFAGRNDSQIKINGNRVEIHEIERVLEKHADVKQCVVYYDAQRTMLHAFVLMSDQARFDRQALSIFIAAYLPLYMRPASIMEVDRIPLNQNLKVDRKALFMASSAAFLKKRKKHPSDLHRCRSVEELQHALARIDIDIAALIGEFIKPTANRAIIVAGSIAEQTASSVSDLDLLVLLDSHQAFKKLRSEIYGHRVNLVPSNDTDERVFSMIVNGLEIECQFLVNESLVPDATDDSAAARRSRLTENNKFLCRLSSSWVVHDDGLLAPWRECYATGSLRIKRTTEEFMSAAKNLEDMAVAVGEDRAHVGSMGIYIATHLMLALLADDRYFSKSAKWMKRVTRLQEDRSDDLAALLHRGQMLLFAGLQDTLESQRDYFDQILLYCAEVRTYLSRDDQIGGMLDTLIVDFDIIL